MKIENFDEKLMWIRRIKHMILSYKEELNEMEKRKYDEVSGEIAYTKQELNTFIALYFRDLKNL